MGLYLTGRWIARLSIAGLGALALAGCQTTEELAVQDDAACAAIGITSTSQRYGECRLIMERKRIAERQEKAARMQAFGAAMQNAGNSLGGPSPSPGTSSSGGTCFKKSEATSGFNKICYYDCLGSLTARNIGSAELCPLTIEN